MENMEVAELIKQFQEKYEVQEKYIEELRGIKHDIQAHMIVLKYYLQEEEWEKAKEYLDTLIEVQGKITTEEIDTGNKFVDAIISYQKKRCKCKVDIEIEDAFPAKLKIDDYDLCTICSNLFSNALEACEHLTSAKAHIKCRIIVEEKNLILSIQNPVEGEINLDILGNGTTKDDSCNHGYGIKNVKRAVDKYNGNIAYKLENGLISVKVYLPSIV